MASVEAEVASTSALAPQAVPSGVTKFLKDVVAGTCGGVMVTFVGHPFDTVKVRLQTQPTINPMYNGMVDCFRKTLQWEGVPGLYKGVTSPLAGQMVFRASLFSAFGASKRWLATNPDGTTRELTTPDFFKAGAMTGFVAAMSEAPIDFYKSQMQVQIIRSKMDPAYKPPFTSVLQCVKQTFQINGMRAPFQGFAPTLIRNVPANSIYLGLFEVGKQQAAQYYGCHTRDLPMHVVVGSAGVGALAYWLACYPIDVIKSAMMTDAIDPAQRKFPTMAVAAQKLWAEGGWRRFYRGFTPCLARAVPANGAMLLTVERVTALLNPE